MNVLKSLKEFFSPVSSDPVGLCSFEHTQKVKKTSNIKPKQNKEMRLSELME